MAKRKRKETPPEQAPEDRGDAYEPADVPPEAAAGPWDSAAGYVREVPNPPAPGSQPTPPAAPSPAEEQPAGAGQPLTQQFLKAFAVAEAAYESDSRAGAVSVDPAIRRLYLAAMKLFDALPPQSLASVTEQIRSDARYPRCAHCVTSKQLRHYLHSLSELGAPPP